MPSPWLMARASGFYGRVFVPADLRPVLGQRFLVRALDARDRDEARLMAARLALAAGDLYRQLRRGLTMAEPKVSDVFASLQSGKARELIIRWLRSASGDPIELRNGHCAAARLHSQRNRGARLHRAVLNPCVADRAQVPAVSTAAAAQDIERRQWHAQPAVAVA